MSRQVRALLWPMVMRTKFQRSPTKLIARAGVPQGDPTSPQLFAIFMDSFLEVANERPWQSLASLFVDDVLTLARPSDNLQQLLDIAHQRAIDRDIVWNIAKSCGLNLPQTHKVNGSLLPDAVKATYLGVTLTSQGVAGSKLIDRLTAARVLLFKLTRTTKG